MIFATEAGSYEYITTHRVASEHWTTEGVSMMMDAAGRAEIKATFDKPGAKILFFGVQ